MLYKCFLKSIFPNFENNSLHFEFFCHYCWQQISLHSCPFCLVKYKFFKSRNYNNLHGSLASSSEELDIF